MPSPAVVYERRRPEETTLYQVVQDNLATLYGAVDDGALAIALPKFVRKELEGYLDCGLLCRGFARLRCDGCEETRLVAFSCKGRGFCPSCLGRKMAATAAHLVEDVLPVGVPLRQWVLTVPFAWRKRLGYDGPLLSALTRLFVKTVLAFYRERGGGARGQSGAVVAVQRTSSDLKLNPHVHAVFLDGVYRDKEQGGDELEFRALVHLSTRDVALVVERTRDRMTKYLRRRGLLADGDGDDAEEGDASERAGLTRLAASAISGATPPAGPEWRRGALPLRHRAMVFERPLCVALDGFTLHGATRAGVRRGERSQLPPQRHNGDGERAPCVRPRGEGGRAVTSHRRRIPPPWRFAEPLPFTDWTLPVLDLFPPRIGSAVHAVGYHSARAEVDHARREIHVHREIAISDGIVVDVHEERRDARLNFPCFQTDARFDGGMSGGPVFNDAGALCGIISSNLPPSADGEPHVSYVATLWPIAGTIIDFGRVDSTRAEPVLALMVDGVIKAQGHEFVIVQKSIEGEVSVASAQGSRSWLSR